MASGTTAAGCGHSRWSSENSLSFPRDCVVCGVLSYRSEWLAPGMTNGSLARPSKRQGGVALLGEQLGVRVGDLLLHAEERVVDEDGCVFAVGVEVRQEEEVGRNHGLGLGGVFRPSVSLLGPSKEAAVPY